MSASRGLFYLALALAVLPLGAADRLGLAVSVTSIAALTLATAFVPLRDGRLARIYWMTVAVLVVLVLYVLFQCLRFPGNPFANPIWQTVGDQLGAHSGSISVAPNESLYALGGLVSPFLIFMAGLVLFQGDYAARSLWRTLAIGGGLVGLFGLIQFLAFPSSLLIFSKIYYLDSLTAVFINRNTAATFLGIASLLLFGCCVGSLDRARRASGGGLFSEMSARRLRRPLIYAALFCVTILALLLTKSRGGVAATVIGFILAVGILSTRPQAERVNGVAPAVDRLKPFVAVAAVLVVALVFSGQTILRAQTQGLDNARFCILPGVLAAIRDNWLWGTGLATFDQIFPMYRDATCGIDGSWLRAHNSFLEGYLGLGAIFVPVVLLIYFVLVSTLIRGIRKRRRRRYAPLAALGVLVLVTAHALIDFSMQVQGVRVFFAAAMAAAVTLCFRPKPAGASLPARSNQP